MTNFVMVLLPGGLPGDLVNFGQVPDFIVHPACARCAIQSPKSRAFDLAGRNDHLLQVRLNGRTRTRSRANQKPLRDSPYFAYRPPCGSEATCAFSLTEIHRFQGTEGRIGLRRRTVYYAVHAYHVSSWLSGIALSTTFATKAAKSGSKRPTTSGRPTTPIGGKPFQLIFVLFHRGTSPHCPEGHLLISNPPRIILRRWAAEPYCELSPSSAFGSVHVCWFRMSLYAVPNSLLWG